MFRITKDRIVARLNTARIAPVMESQLLIDEGSFIIFRNSFLKRPKVRNKIALIQYRSAIYTLSIYELKLY